MWLEDELRDKNNCKQRGRRTLYRNLLKIFQAWGSAFFLLYFLPRSIGIHLLRQMYILKLVRAKVLVPKVLMETVNGGRKCLP